MSHPARDRIAFAIVKGRRSRVGRELEYNGEFCKNHPELPADGLPCPNVRCKDGTDSARIYRDGTVWGRAKKKGVWTWVQLYVYV